MDVLYSDTHFFAVNKPSGIGVHRSALIQDTVTALDTAVLQAGTSLHTLHRLDRPASGVLLFGVDSTAVRWCTPERWRVDVEKTYLAIVRGHTPDEGLIERPLAAMHRRERPSWSRQRGRSTHEGGIEQASDTAVKDAVTRYSTLARYEVPLPSRRYATSRFSLVRVTPETGRFHQIRRHLAGIGYPIIGDATHGDTGTNRIVSTWCAEQRLMLHCRTLSMPHPDTGTRMRIDAPLFSDMNRFISLLSLSRHCKPGN
ncbi:MAG: tRNA pseudouridine(65) synthase TruC [Spirochaetales bacterium]|nr:tRNA pseudouridine(65) synthase TruC [Spirochaetales bacterium]